jgi:hypothetical protein
MLDYNKEKDFLGMTKSEGCHDHQKQIKDNSAAEDLKDGRSCLLGLAAAEIAGGSSLLL